MSASSCPTTIPESRLEADRRRERDRVAKQRWRERKRQEEKNNSPSTRNANLEQHTSSLASAPPTYTHHVDPSPYESLITVPCNEAGSLTQPLWHQAQNALSFDQPLDFAREHFLITSPLYNNAQLNPVPFEDSRLLRPESLPPDHTHVSNSWNQQTNFTHSLVASNHRNFKQSALHVAVINGSVGIVEALLTAGADMNVRDFNSSSPLLLAVQHRQKDIVAILLNSGADPEIPSEDGRTPLELAVRMCDEDTVRLLISYGARVK